MAGAAARPRPGGRNEQNRLAVARAVLELLAEGDVELGPATVAARAGVHRSTVYRRWPTRADLLREGLALHTSSLRLVESGVWAEDLDAMVRAFAEFFARPVEVAMNAAVAGRSDVEQAAVLLRHWGPIVASCEAMVARAQVRGEIAADLDAATVLGLAVSPLLVTVLFLDRAPTSDEMTSVVTLVRRATAPKGRDDDRPRS